MSNTPSNRRVPKSEPPLSAESDPSAALPDTAYETPMARTSTNPSSDASERKGGERPAVVGRRARRRRQGPEQPSRTRPWLQRFQLLTGIIVVLSASVLVAWGLRRYLHTSPRFAVRTVEINGNNKLGAEQVLKLANLQPGQNSFLVDETRAANAIAADPWITSASVTVELPSRLTVDVVEREPRALAAIDGELLLVDADGKLFKTFEHGDPSDLPLLTGIDPDALAGDRSGVEKRYRRALDLLSDLEAAKVTRRYPVQEIHLQADARFVVTVGTDGIGLHFGRAPFRGKIEKLKRILGELRYRKVKPAMLFLDNEAHPERVVVRMKG